mmetsp:Transcript_12268/g.21549  ORF Transcript_12268/g.21549 Transcript_12268/m.21549 type:complete len:181 (+) Transcript_12268:151-693(+)
MEYFRRQPNLKPYFANSYGFALFETIAKGGMGIGGAYGEGEVYILKQQGNEHELVGKSTMAQLSVGFQFGGQVYSEIIFFETERDFKHFTSDNFEFGAHANVVALTASAGTSASTMGNQGITAGLNANDVILEQKELDKLYTKGMAIFTITRGGLMYEATVKGQRFNFKPLDGSNPAETK